jgi:hypothetical protein
VIVFLATQYSTTTGMSAKLISGWRQSIISNLGRELVMILKKCGNEDCCVSTGICGSLTFGRGELDGLGYWEFPCAICARYYEKEDGCRWKCWPFKKSRKENV